MPAPKENISEKLKMNKEIARQKEKLEQQLGYWHVQLAEAMLQVEEAGNAKTEFLFTMSHDIRAPMNAIPGFTNLAPESEDPETQREYLKNIDISSKQLPDLINNIPDLSKIEKKMARCRLNNNQETNPRHFNAEYTPSSSTVPVISCAA